MTVWRGATAPSTATTPWRHLEEQSVAAGDRTLLTESLGVGAKAKACKGMAGLIEEGQEVIEEGQGQDDVAADLAFIAAHKR